MDKCLPQGLGFVYKHRIHHILFSPGASS